MVLQHALLLHECRVIIEVYLVLVWQEPAATERVSTMPALPQAAWVRAHSGVTPSRAGSTGALLMGDESARRTECRGVILPTVALCLIYSYIPWEFPRYQGTVRSIVRSV